MFFLVLFLTLSLSFGEEVLVASASSLRPALEKIAPLFEKKEGVKVKVSYGSSGNLYRQILGGAPYDVFLSANRLYAEKVLRRLNLPKENLKVFALGRLVIFSVQRKLEKFEDILSAERVAIANPRHAPYGMAAVAFLKNKGFYKKLRTKLVYGANVGQAFQFVVSGGAQMGIVSLSYVKLYGRGSYLVVPKDLHPPIEHTSLLTRRGMEKEHAKRFFEFLGSEEALRIIRESGFEIPK